MKKYKLIINLTNGGRVKGIGTKQGVEKRLAWWVNNTNQVIDYSIMEV